MFGCKGVVTADLRPHYGVLRIVRKDNRMPPAGNPILSYRTTVTPVLPLQRRDATLRRRLDLAEATAHEALVEVHAQQAVDFVRVLAPRMPFDAAVDEYVGAMGLGDEEADGVRNRALTLLSESDGEDLARERPKGKGFDWRYATPAGAVRLFRRHRRQSAEEELWVELAAARAEEAVIRAHVRQALRFVELLAAAEPPTDAVSEYVERLQLPESRGRSVYQRALAALAETVLPRLNRQPRRGSRSSH